MQQPSPPPSAPPAPPSSTDKPQDGIPYIGSRISLISKTDIRYEGFLFNIDTRQSMVALQSVRSFGTEGRRAEHVPPSPQVLQYATFKASEIQDLHVCEAAPPPPPPQPAAPQPQPQAYAQPSYPPPMPSGPPPPMPSAPQQPKSAMAAPSKPTLLTPGSVSSAQMHQTPSPRQAQPPVAMYSQQPMQPSYGQHQQMQQSAPRPSYNSNPNRRQGGSQSGQGANNATRTIPGMGGHLLKRKERRVPGGNAEVGGVGPAAASGEFNFAEGLNDFDKQEEFSKLDEEVKPETKGSYQKSSFFDTISCDALDRLEGQRSRITGAEERKLNTETFGAVGLNNRRNFRGGRGGRGGRRNGGYRSGNWNGGRGNGMGPGNGGRGRNPNRPQATGP
ncbi:hypothetical protein BBJ28_00007654 [Nothophytophthora sp. Chile5]|nr:hypothetical protein BBJ28_00007654 [Nothophytophthora sp. Chile5]